MCVRDAGPRCNHWVHLCYLFFCFAGFFPLFEVKNLTDVNVFHAYPTLKQIQVVCSSVQTGENMFKCCVFFPFYIDLKPFSEHMFEFKIGNMIKKLFKSFWFVNGPWQIKASEISQLVQKFLSGMDNVRSQALRV